MGRLLLISIIVITAGISLARPWIGISAYYLLAVMGPQYIWWWDFEGLRASFWVAAFALAGLGIKLFQGQYNFDLLSTRQNLWLFLLWVFISLSYFFGPYVSYYDYKNLNLAPDVLFENANKIFLFYFCATLAVNDIKKLRYFTFIIIVSTVYFIYWANSQYFSGNWSQFNFGRLMGPTSLGGGAIYKDENNFAMLFVTGLPFIYYMSLLVGRKWLRYASWCIIPLGWHAVFLTGSRGGLVGLGVVTLLSTLKSKRKYLGLFLMLSFLFFYQWQAGDVMKERSTTIADYDSEYSARGRLVAWGAGLSMIKDHPFSGVGLGSFVTAFSHYTDDKNRVAHNTFVQFAAESGVGAGFCYLMIVVTFFRNSFRIMKSNNYIQKDPDVKWIQYLNSASMTSFVGLIVCSLFLSLPFFEIFFYLLIINNALTILHKRQITNTAIG